MFGEKKEDWGVYWRWIIDSPFSKIKIHEGIHRLDPSVIRPDVRGRSRLSGNDSNIGSSDGIIISDGGMFRLNCF